MRHNDSIRNGSFDLRLGVGDRDYVYWNSRWFHYVFDWQAENCFFNAYDPFRALSLSQYRTKDAALQTFES